MNQALKRLGWLVLAISVQAGCGSKAGPPDQPDPGDPLEVASTQPTHGQVGVAQAAPIEIRFAEPVADPAAGRYFVLPDPGQLLASWSNDLTALTLDHLPFAADTIYTVVIRGYTTKQGAVMADRSFSFSTGPAVIPLLVVSSTSPSDGAVEVPLETTIEIVFSLPVSNRNQGKTTFLPGVSGQERRWLDEGSRLVIDHLPLAEDQVYSVTVEGYQAAPDKPMASYRFGFTTN